MRNLDKSKGGQPFLEVFVRCAQRVGAGELITRESRQDKEFHFQNWFRARLTETGLNFEAGGRNSYPDFRPIRYAFDTRANTLVPELVDNPSAGREHSFSAFRLKGVGGEEVAMCLSSESSEAPLGISRTLGLLGLELC